MIDPVTAFSVATAAYNGVVKLVNAGREFEDVVGQMGKWYTAVSDIRQAKAINEKPPLFKKLFNAGSIEEEALALLLHEKKLAEQEKELMSILNWRYGPTTWAELIELRRKIKAERERTVYRQLARRRAWLEGIAITLLITVGAAVIVGTIWFIHNFKA